MNASLLLDRLDARGVRVWLEGKQVRVSAPKQALTRQLRLWLNVYETELATVLAFRPRDPWKNAKPLKEGELPHQRLYPYLGRRVGTPRGPGILRLVFEKRAEIALEGGDRLIEMAPEDVWPLEHG